MDATSATSAARQAANRLNAQKSTGPRSAEGKARVAQNRTSHGLTSAHALLPNEDPAAFAALKESLQDEHRPHSETEHRLVDELAHAQWKLRRAEAMEIAALARAIDPATGLPILTDEIVRLARYQAGIRRAWNNAFTRLRQLQTDRRKALSLALDFALAKAKAAPPPGDETKPTPAPPDDGHSPIPSRDREEAVPRTS